MLKPNYNGVSPSYTPCIYQIKKFLVIGARFTLPGLRATMRAAEIAHFLRKIADKHLDLVKVSGLPPTQYWKLKIIIIYWK